MHLCKLQCCVVSFFVVLMTPRPALGVTPLSTARTYWEQHAATCSGFPSKDHCDDGDMALFGGLLCASGESPGCELVRASQDTSGRWWRSPRRSPGNLGQGNSFSRDMALGVLLYLTATKDADAAVKWLDWIKDNRPCLVEKPFGGGCMIRGPHRYCTDDTFNSCTLTPSSWSLMARVWEHLGLPLSFDMQANRDADADALPTQARHAETGYPLHLLAAEILLKSRVGDDSRQKRAATDILAQRQPLNPFFLYLRNGPSEALKTMVRQLCPKPDSSTWTEHQQWAWERDTDSAAWRQSMGWDCIFMANLLEP